MDYLLFACGVLSGAFASLLLLLCGGFITVSFGRWRSESPPLQWPASPDITPSLPVQEVETPSKDTSWKKEIPKL